MRWAMCGRKGLKSRGNSYGYGLGYLRWCNFTDKPCQEAAMRCSGPFVQEHKVAKLIKDHEELD